MRPNWREIRFCGALVWWIAGARGLGGTEDALPPRQVLREGWQIQSAVLVGKPGEAVSSAAYRTEGWFPTVVPSTVLNALVKNGVYPDPRLGLNAFRIPDSSDDFNRSHDLARFSHLGQGRNPWRDPWWYRAGFELPRPVPGQRCWLHFDAINYRAEVWLNGALIADARQMAGMFQRFQFDVTRAARPGPNILAVKVWPVDHPGTPDTQLEVLGPDRAYVGKEIMRDVTEIMTIGYDCMMTVPDRNMGLWQKVWIDWTGPVDLRHPFVVTQLPLPDTDRATLTVSAELVNNTDQPVPGTLRGTVTGTDVRFAQPVELGPGESRLVMIEPKPVLRHPRLWWPVPYGEPHLYELDLQFSTQTASGQTSAVSDTDQVRFGVRTVGCDLHEHGGYHGRRLLINGQRIFCRGGYIQPELMFDWDVDRMETEIRYYASAHLNLIYFEDIPNPPEPFLELCDRYGVLFGNVFYSCYWLRPGTPYPDDFPLLERCTVDLVKRYRNHPSLVLYMAMNEEYTKENVYEMWRRNILALDGTRWLIPSAYFPSDRKDVPAWFKKDLPVGMTDIGASYSWADPAQYFRWVEAGRNWMFMMESGSASLPPISSLARFLPEVREPGPAGTPLFPLNADWAHHGANQYFKGYDSALRQLHGEPDSVTDYCWKGHLVTADQHRSMFEAVNHRMWDITSGFTQWKLNACEPSVQWQIFDWFHKPMVSFFYIKKACQPLHVQLSRTDPVIHVVNTRLNPQPGLAVTARVFDLHAQPLWQHTATLDLPANSAHEAFTITNLPNLAPFTFVKLELKNAAHQVLADNFYWLPGQGAQDFKALQNLPPVKLQAALQFDDPPSNNIARVQIRNPTAHVAFFIQLALTRESTGEEILPVFWEDNYFSLLPGEIRELTARLPASPPRNAKPKLEVGGWNAWNEFNCSNLQASPNSIRSGQRVDLTATVTHTFLDGSRVPLLVDGQTAALKWCWARQNTNTLRYSITLTQPGQHTLQLGDKTVQVRVD